MTIQESASVTHPPGTCNAEIQTFGHIQLLNLKPPGVHQNVKILSHRMQKKKCFSHYKISPAGRWGEVLDGTWVDFERWEGWWAGSLFWSSVSLYWFSGVHWVRLFCPAETTRRCHLIGLVWFYARVVVDGRSLQIPGHVLWLLVAPKQPDTECTGPRNWSCLVTGSFPFDCLFLYFDSLQFILQL